MRLLSMLAALWLALAVSRCQEPAPKAPEPDPRPGDFVRLRGTLAEDVDCRLLRVESGKLYSLNVRLRGWPNGAKICLHGTVVEGTSCMTAPMIEVESVKPLSACP